MSDKLRLLMAYALDIDAAGQNSVQRITTFFKLIIIPFFLKISIIKNKKAFTYNPGKKYKTIA